MYFESSGVPIELHTTKIYCKRINCFMSCNVLIVLLPQRIKLYYFIIIIIIIIKGMFFGYCLFILCSYINMYCMSDVNCV